METNNHFVWGWCFDIIYFEKYLFSKWPRIHFNNFLEDANKIFIWRTTNMVFTTDTRVKDSVSYVILMCSKMTIVQCDFGLFFILNITTNTDIEQLVRHILTIVFNNLHNVTNPNINGLCSSGSWLLRSFCDTSLFKRIFLATFICSITINVILHA